MEPPRFPALPGGSRTPPPSVAWLASNSAVGGGGEIKLASQALGLFHVKWRGRVCQMVPAAFGPSGGFAPARAPTLPPRDPPGHAPTRACLFLALPHPTVCVSSYTLKRLEGTASALAGSESFLSHPPDDCLCGFDGLDGYHG